MQVSTSVRIVLAGESIETGLLMTLSERVKNGWEAGSELLCLEVLQEASVQAAKFRNKSLQILLSSDDPNVRPALGLNAEIIALMAQLGCSLDFDPYCESTTEVMERFLQGIREH